MGEKEEKTFASKSLDLRVIGYLFSFISFAVFVYVFVVEVKNGKIENSIYWLLLSLGSALLPVVEKLKFKDFEVVFKKEIEKVRDDIKKETGLIKQNQAQVIYNELYRMQQDILGYMQRRDVESAQNANSNMLENIDVLKTQDIFDDRIRNFEGFAYKNAVQFSKWKGLENEAKEYSKKAREVFEKNLQKNPADESALLGLSNIEFYTGDIDKAIDYAKRALVINPDYRSAQHDLDLYEKEKKKRSE